MNGVNHARGILNQSLYEVHKQHILQILLLQSALSPIT